MVEPKSIDTIIKNVRKIAKEHPDAVYDSSSRIDHYSYTAGEAGGGEGCIIGQASIGSFVHELDISEPIGIDSLVYELNSQDLLVDCTGKKVNWLSQVQTYQDAGHTWSYAVKRTDNVVGTVLKEQT